MDRKPDRKPDGRAKLFSLEQDDLWVEALVPADSAMGPSESISFQVSAISHLRSLGAKNTVIALTGGPEIVVALPKAELMEQMATGGAGETLDLKPVTVLEARPLLMQRLRVEFAEAQEQEKYADFNALTFTAFVRLPQQKEYKELTFSGKDVRADKISEGGSIMGGQALTFMLRKPLPDYPDGQFLLESTKEEFNEMCQKATALGQTTLDLRDYSMRKGTLTPEERLAQGLPPKEFKRSAP